MNQDGSLRARLKNETADAHVAIETRMGIMADGLTIERYIEILRAFYSFYVPFESKLTSLVGISEAASFYAPARLKREHLERDLAYFDQRNGGLVTLPETNREAFQFLESNQAWGALYVVEGSTLGGQLITRHMRERLNLQSGAGLEFFAGYGDQTGARWKEFCVALGQLEARNVEPDEVILGANRTFRIMSERF